MQANHLKHNEKTWDCRVAPFGSPRNDKGGIVSRHVLGMTIIMLSLRARQGVAIQSEALLGMLRRYGGMPEGSAGLPRRYAPRNDKVWDDWIAASLRSSQ